MLLCLSGCTSVNNGSVRYWVIGFGVVTVSSTNSVQVAKSKVAGASFVTDPKPSLKLGYSETVNVRIPTDSSNSVIEVKGIK